LPYWRRCLLHLVLARTPQSSASSMRFCSDLYRFLSQPSCFDSTRVLRSRRILIFSTTEIKTKSSADSRRTDLHLSIWRVTDIRNGFWERLSAVTTLPFSGSQYVLVATFLRRKIKLPAQLL